MAKFTAGVGFGQASGSIAGTTYSRNRFGTYIRNRAVPVNPSSSSQASVRARFGAQSAAWRGLSAAERLQWNTQAPLVDLVDTLGQTYNPSGAQFYSSINLYRSITGQAALTVPPIADTPPALLTLSATAAAGTPELSIAFTGAIATGDFVILQATAPNSAGRDFFGRSEYKQIAVLDDTDTTPFNALSAYNAVFGALGAGDAGAKISIRAVPVSANGFAQAHSRADVIVAA